MLTEAVRQRPYSVVQLDEMEKAHMDVNLLFNRGTPCNTCTGDANGDGNIDAFDIEPFLDCLFP